ncbi:MAG: hypothetical protein E6R04_06895 [Spirochaetes bacterium]|nr:MAG: hypothetical protein E6R04_06895 [Spirochaetota bacterium]
MTTPNQFADPNAQFTPAAPATSPGGIVIPPAPQAPFQAPVPQAAPVQQGYPQAAPVQQAAPAPAPTFPHMAANTPNPSVVGADAFGQSASNSGVKMKDFLGQPLLFRIIEPYVWTNQQGNQVEAVRVDFVVLDPTNPQVFTGVGVSNSPIVRDLKNTIANGKRYHVGRVMEVASKHPQPALALGPLTDDETNFAIQVCQANGWA